jgi:hypothetical protein
VVDTGAPRSATAAHVQGFLSRDRMSPPDFLAAGRAEVKAYDVELVEDRVVAIENVCLAGGRTLLARRVLMPVDRLLQHRRDRRRVI